MLGEIFLEGLGYYYVVENLPSIYEAWVLPIPLQSKTMSL